MFSSSCIVKKYYQYRKKQHLPTIKRILSDDVWNEIKNILSKEKPCNNKGHPAAVVPFRKVLDGILFVLRTGCQWKEMLPKEYGSGSTCHRRFQHWVRMGIFQKLWISLLKIYDYLQGIKLKWQSLDSVSVKAPLGG
jgi:transposase